LSVVKRDRLEVLCKEIWNMKRVQVVVFGLLIAALLVYSCAIVPLTGRRQLSLVSDSEMLSMSFGEYDTFLKENKLSTNTAQVNMVKQVGGRIENAVEAYFARSGMSQQLAGYAWEFNLIESDEVNAWCMPGGKVVVYTGILPITKDATGLAVVMGHEIAHAVAKHSNERMSQALIAQLGGETLSAALQNKSEQTKQIWMGLFGVGAQVGVLLPYSRIQESEADHLGLIFMAMAGYDPHAALDFWQRMSENAGAKPPEFLSTHPADATRLAKIREEIPEAMKYYKK
jgi:predicted Zn-dependent protease